MAKHSTIVVLAIGGAIVVFALLLTVSEVYSPGSDLDTTETVAENDTQNTPVEAQVDPVPAPVINADERDAILTETEPREKPMASGVFSDVPEEDIEQSLLDDFLSSRPVDKHRVVTVNTDSIREFIRMEGQDASFSIQLFDDEIVTITATGVQEHSSGWQTGMATWLGRVQEYDDSQVQFLITPDGAIDGTITTPRHGRISIDVVKGTPHHVMWTWTEGYSRPID